MKRALVVVVLTAVACLFAAYAVTYAVERGYYAFVFALRQMPTPEAVEEPAEVEEPEQEGAPLFQDLLRRLPRPPPPVEKPFYAPRGQGPDRELSSTKLSEIIDDCETYVFFNGTYWFCAEAQEVQQDEPTDSPPTVEGPGDPPLAVWAPVHGPGFRPPSIIYENIL